MHGRQESSNCQRRFSIDVIEDVTRLTAPAMDVSEEEVAAVLGLGYGIFSGNTVKTAVLQFSRDRARWVQNEVWHPDQVGTLKRDGSYRLELPYSDERELLADLMKYGHTVEVIGPASLRASIKRAFQGALGLYN
jgi:predicted DNA-binding transcriptional regulator YafY